MPMPQGQQLPTAASTIGELAEPTRCGHPLLQTDRNKAATETDVALPVHGNEAIDSAQI